MGGVSPSATLGATPVGDPAPAAAGDAASRVVTSSLLWRHSFGEMRIETCADGSVWIDGKVVPDTLPAGQQPAHKVP